MTNETIADIIAEMRSDANADEYTPDGILGQTLNCLADRLEAAYKREVATTKESLAVGNSGDCAKLREVLEAIWKEVYFYAIEEDKQDFAHLHEAMLEDPPEYKDLRNSFFAIAHLVDAALVAPPRNCDRPECATTKAAADVWRKEDGGKTAYHEWLLASSTEKEGGKDENK